MRALAATRFVVFLTRRAGGADALLAQVAAGAVLPLGRRSFAAAELEAFLGQMAAAQIEVVESAEAELIALPAPVVAVAEYDAPATHAKPVESTWLSLSEIVLKTQKIRGPNVR